MRRMASVLVVEDDQFVRSALIRHLTDASHTVRSVGTALEALREVAHFRFDVVILDLGLPDLDGSEALKMLRGITDVPVIVATARDDEGEIVRLLNAGADDYLTKPFSVEHLSARMAAVLRRARSGAPEGEPSPVIRVGGLSVDPLRRQAELDGARLDLTRREFDLLAFPRPAARVSSSPARSCSPRCGSSRTATTRPSTSICPGCAGNWARRPPTRAICTPFGASE
ncbi:two-component system response regulator [Streptomyces viridochromogenes DSM 40736]|uniref:Two-component system response regulator n=1 Tax=Streptomyces viridochromogenes (strain DSM 40736 / JCM 4977 / BCRC 1201 / Tue 494) TaxID=591159 RepID=D9XB30_STRVT|nr:two-component system response regulator [Streptomyces viridochromogenes DSM 40736]